MGNVNKTVSKINNLTVLCENLWPISYYLGGPLLAGSQLRQFKNVLKIN